MSNDYITPFETSNISNVNTTTSARNINIVDDSDVSIMTNNSNSAMNYILSPFDLEEKDIELIKKELERKIQEQKEDIENTKNTRGWVTSAWNGICSFLGRGDKEAENSISNNEKLLAGLDFDISNINDIYKKIIGNDLDFASLQILRDSENLTNSIDSEKQNEIVLELEKQIAILESNFETAQNSNGWISGTWNAFKNWTGIGASSNKTAAEISNLKEQVENLKNGKSDLAVTYKNITGNDLNYYNLSSLLSGEEGTGLDSISNAGQSINAYTEGQKMCTDIVGDMVSGIIAVGAIAAAPFSGGASLLLAAGVGAGVKVAIKASDCIGNEKTYGLKDFGYDVVTGSINGAMAPISNGLGGAAGTSISKLFGLKTAESVAKEGLEQAVKVAGKEVIEEGAEQVSKGIITKILAKQGTEYVLKEGTEATVKTTIGKVLSYGADMAVDGALSGATDGFARAAAEGRWQDIPQEVLTGSLGGLIASPIIGGGFRIAGKAGSTVINKINNKITIGSLLPDGSMTKFSQGDMGDCALLSMLDGFMANPTTSKQIKNAITTSADGGYNVKIGSQIIKIARDELSDEMLSDVTGIRVFELAYQKAGGSLDGEFAENVAKTFGLNSVHITADGITDEVLEKISKDSDNLILSLGARVNADGTITPDGEFQHYFSIKSVDSKARIVTLVDTYDTSKTFEMAFDDVKTQGISIDGGSIKKTDLQNIERKVDEIAFRGNNSTNAADFLNNTNITVKEQYGFYLYDVEKSIGEWLQDYGVTPNNIKQDAIDFVSRLNPEVVQYLTEFGDNNNYLARLLTKSDIFGKVDFSTITKNADFMNYLSETTINGKNLLLQVDNVKFLENKDFDTEGMTRLIEAFKNVRITQPETNKYNFTMFSNLADGHNSITKILNSSTIKPIETAEFLEALANIKITKANGAEWSFSDILKENWLYNSIFDETIDFDKVIQLCECISKSDMYSKLSQKDMSQITSLINNISKSKYTNMQEYFDSYKYFKTLTTSNGTEMLSGRKGRMTPEKIHSYMLNIDTSSVEASNIEMLINLVQDGVVSEHVFEYLPSSGKLNQSIISDIDKLYEAYTLGIKPIDMFVPTFKNAAEAVAGGNDSILFKDTYLDIKAGDVFQVEGEDFIRIKISDTKSQKLNISKDTYFKLFPPIERYATTQNNIGNCWEITGINSLLCEPDTRASILKLFSQDGDDIVIKFPNGQYKEIRFKNGELPANVDDQFYSKGALGIQMIEYADGKEMQGEWINQAYEKIKEMIAIESDDNRRKNFEQGLVDFTEFVESHDGNVVINLRNGVHWDTYDGEYDSIMSTNRVNGTSNSLYARLGYDEAQCLLFYNAGEWNKAQDLLKNSKSFDDYIISWASDGQGIEKSVDAELGIVSNHAYRIKPAKIAPDGTAETFKLINPWGIVDTELTYDQVLKYGKALYIAKK